MKCTRTAVFRRSTTNRVSPPGRRAGLSEKRGGTINRGREDAWTRPVGDSGGGVHKKKTAYATITTKGGKIAYGSRDFAIENLTGATG